jgi:hypothetical protein
MKTVWIKPLFIFAGLYDAILAIAFLFWAGAIFQWYGVPPPNHLAYVKFPALLLLIFAAMFFRIASDPIKNRHLIAYGIALKMAYCGTVFWYHFTEGVPSMWIPWAWADLAFLVLFLIAGKSAAPGRS